MEFINITKLVLSPAHLINIHMMQFEDHKKGMIRRLKSAKNIEELKKELAICLNIAMEKKKQEG